MRRVVLDRDGVCRSYSGRTTDRHSDDDRRRTVTLLPDVGREPAHGSGKLVAGYTGGRPPHPWTVDVSDLGHADLGAAMRGLADGE
jgi:hypothetical protein